MQHTEDFWLKSLYRSAAALKTVYKIPICFLYQNGHNPKVYGSSKLAEKLSNSMQKSSWQDAITEDSDELSRSNIPNNFNPDIAYREAEALESLPRLKQPLAYMNISECREYVSKYYLKYLKC